MLLTDKEFFQLEDKARDLRLLTIDTTFWAGSAHVGGAMSVADILTVLYYKILQIDPKNPDWEDRDRFILSKGHAGVAHASILAMKGYFDVDELKTFNHNGSKFGMHLDRNKVKGVDVSSGSLGHGLSVALGIALAARARHKDYRTYVVLGDGECNEGSVWEAAMACAHYKATNIITFVDKNGFSLDGSTQSIMNIDPLADKWTSFGFYVQEIDGNNIKELVGAIEKAQQENERPSVIICRTVKSCGIKEWENDYRWHYAGIDEATREMCKKSIEAYHARRRVR